MFFLRPCDKFTWLVTVTFYVIFIFNEIYKVHGHIRWLHNIVRGIDRRLWWCQRRCFFMIGVAYRIAHCTAAIGGFQSVGWPLKKKKKKSKKYNNKTFAAVVEEEEKGTPRAHKNYPVPRDDCCIIVEVFFLLPAFYTALFFYRTFFLSFGHILVGWQWGRAIFNGYLIF